MKRVIRVTVVAEYTTDSSYYTTENTAMKMALCDLKNDPGCFLADADDFHIQHAMFVEEGDRAGVTFADDGKAN